MRTSSTVMISCLTADDAGSSVRLTWTIPLLLHPTAAAARAMNTNRMGGLRKKLRRCSECGPRSASVDRRTVDVGGVREAKKKPALGGSRPSTVGAQDRTRTCTVLPTSPSSWRVCQFHHLGEAG